MIKGATDNGDYLVQVSAQVMTRDDSTGGWVPVGGGGLSRVRLCKLSPPEDSSGSAEVPGGGSGSISGPMGLPPSEQASDTAYRIKPEYVIQGVRISDSAAILDCRLKKDIQYTKPNPKWHHWKTDDKRYGLTFERTEDAKAFDQGIRIAVADLSEGVSDGSAPPEGDEGVFSYMDLPLLRKDSSSRSASTTSTTTSSPGTNSPPSSLNINNNNNNDPFTFMHHYNNHLHRVHYISSPHAHARNVHSNGGNVYVGHPPHLHQQQQQQQQNSKQLHQHSHHHHPHHPHLHQLHHHQQQQQQIHQYHNLPHQTGVSPAISERSSPNKSSFDSISSPTGPELEEVWVRTSYEQQPSAVLGGKPSHPGLLVDCGDSDSDCPKHLDCSKESSYVVFNKNNKGGAPLPHEYSYPNLEPAQKPPAQRSSTKKQALGPSSPTITAPPSSSSSSSQGHSTTTSQPYPASNPHHPSFSQPHHSLPHTNNPPLPIKVKSKSKSSSSSGSGGSSSGGLGLGVGILSGGNGGGGGEGGLKGVQQSGARCRLVSTQVQCKHCRELFSLDNNPRGSCEDAPDSVERCLECVSCVTCAQCLMYHCWADADGEFRHPCSCERGDPGLCKRWTALSFLSLLLPCLWCYLPFKACHHCGTACGICGGRHKAA